MTGPWWWWVVALTGRLEALADRLEAKAADIRRRSRERCVATLRGAGCSQAEADDWFDREFPGRRGRT